MPTMTKIALSAVIILGTALSASAATKHRALNEQIAVHQNGHKELVRRQTGFDSFALAPRATAGSIDDPAVTGGGSFGYNAGLRNNQW